MKHAPIVPAEIDFSDPLSPRSPRFDDRYHAAYGAFEQAAHVFLGGNGLPARWQGCDAFTILETGFGLGNNFLATWAAWRADPQRSARLRFVSIEKHPLRFDDLRRALAGSSEPALAAQLCEAWPPLTPDLHLLSFDEGRVELLLALGDASERLREIVASVDAFYLDGFAPDRNPQMWSPGIFKALSRLAAPGATAATWSAARAVRDGLQQAGFAWRAADGIGGKRHVTLATFEPRAPLRKPVARTGDPRTRTVAIVGGGLAGAACARALAREGLRCTVFDRQAQPASAASGNVAGLFHGVLHPEDGMHARAHRAAALAARDAHARAIVAGVEGQCAGLVRLVPEHADPAPLLGELARSGLPADYLQAWSADQVEAAGGPACAAWFYPGGGWIAPAELARWWLRGDGIAWRGNASVARLERREDGWHLFDASGAPLATADAVVLANAGDATALWSRATDAQGRALAADASWIAPLAMTRGQVSIVAADTPGLRPPAWPIAGAGYALTLKDGAVMCGATTTADDPDTDVRLADHAHNLRQLAAVTGSRLKAPLPEWVAPADDDEHLAATLVARGRLHGRVGWRATAADRLPLVGAVPLQPPDGDAALTDQPRHWPRVPGLFVVSGLGSRGLTWAPLAGRLIASWIADAPYPLPADLVDALDPARFCTRRVRASRRPG
ncbi:FAD-dependent 5-carboxymethylaminomethyl-2-thiouridine(34) oxidoreductase MnmC [Scleromatobacter humisilvae]|uniref:tRNA 5-methylaminomethyl-2-thiouridine biosynthesis bifunctional protein MnmC n=1 Tax=Scleromatobacter humisilvae TaxID=2897159 RepID=A0A9X1YIV2_9BURK|nr:FAD-dependent 5-carboxymethylaminomethyl-2-thiouridine(34) oxidoreductase MnmC [Scleromatobacter humisilvae]MCK9686726.1 FAD-dependent 5-carboxymethylaminomethyl-2-thiouridine(34) oxidoreductase MnmC [Scleromatobacter humisilvae]